jgi:hypothetical protein
VNRLKEVDVVVIGLGTLGALTYWAIDALKDKYLKKPGRLVSP